MNISNELKLVINECCPHPAMKARLLRHFQRELDKIQGAEKIELKLLREILADVKVLLAQSKPKTLSWNVTIRPLEPIEKDKHMDQLDLGQIPLGMRLPVDYVPDAEVDVKSDGNFASVAILEGDATAQVAPGSTNKSWRVFFNGDGAIGTKAAEVAVDGHVGDGDVEVTQRTIWEVVSKDATTFGATIGKLEPIPGA